MSHTTPPIMALVVCLFAGKPAGAPTFNGLVEWWIAEERIGYYDIPSKGIPRREWMLERARTLHGNAAAVIHALEHGGDRNATRTALMDSAAICKVLLLADGAIVLKGDSR